MAAPAAPKPPSPGAISGPTFSDRLSLAGRDIGSYLQSQIPKSCPARCALGVVAAVMFPVTVPFSAGFVAGAMIRLFLAEHRLEKEILKGVQPEQQTPEVKARVFAILKESKIDERGKRATILRDMMKSQGTLESLASTDAKTIESIHGVMQQANCDFKTAQYIHRALGSCSDSTRSSILDAIKGCENKKEVTEALLQVVSKLDPKTLPDTLKSLASADAKAIESIHGVMQQANCDFKTAQYIHNSLKKHPELRDSILDAIKGRENKKAVTEALLQVASKLNPPESIQTLYASPEVQRLLGQTDPSKIEAVTRLLQAGPIMGREALCEELTLCLEYKGDVTELERIMKYARCGMQIAQLIHAVLVTIVEPKVQSFILTLLQSNGGGGVAQVQNTHNQLLKYPALLGMQFDSIAQFDACVSLLNQHKPDPKDPVQMRAIYLMAVSGNSSLDTYNILVSKGLDVLKSAESVAEVQCRTQIADSGLFKNVPPDSKMRRELFAKIEEFVEKTGFEVADKNTIRKELLRAMSRGEGLSAIGNWQALWDMQGSVGCKGICGYIRQAEDLFKDENMNAMVAQVIVMGALKDNYRVVENVVKVLTGEYFEAVSELAQREMILQAMVAVGKNPRPGQTPALAALAVFWEGVDELKKAPKETDANKLNEIRDRCIRKVQSVTLAAGQQLRTGGAVIGNTYGGTDDKTTCDYARQGKGTLQVVDGVGHNNAETREREYPIYDQMFAAVSALSTTYPASLPDATQQILDERKAALRAFGAQYGGSDRMGTLGAKPAGVMAQFVTIGTDTHLVTAQYADTCFVVLQPTSDGRYQYEFKEYAKKSEGLGDKGDVSSRPVKPGAIVFAFTDGIGEFLTQSEIVQVLQAHKPDGDLKQEFIDKIKSMATSPDGSRMRASNTAEKCKLWKLSDPMFHDDIGFAYMSAPA